MKRNFIPSHKSDHDACDVLRNTDFEVVKPFVAELLEWVQDLNWPVARSVAAYLGPHVPEISEEILAILRGKDEVWKYWVIDAILDVDEKNNYPAPLLRELERIAYTPTHSEWEEEVDEMAQGFVENHLSSETISVIYMELIWENANAFQENLAFGEMLESNWADFQEEYAKLTIKNQKGKIRIVDNTYLLRMAKGQLMKLIEQARSEMPGVLKHWKMRYE